MRVFVTSLGAAALLAAGCVAPTPAAEGDDSLCAEAQAHVAACFPDRPVERIGSCAAAEAQQLLGTSCEGLADPGKADFFCALGWLLGLCDPWEVTEEERFAALALRCFESFGAPISLPAGERANGGYAICKATETYPGTALKLERVFEQDVELIRVRVLTLESVLLYVDINVETGELQ